MDSLTQLTLGAAVGEAIIGKQAGRKAAAWGALLGTFPDLDVFISMGGPVADFIYHRSFSHSFLVLGLLAPLWAWIITKLHKQDAHLKRRWLCMVFAVFYTHILLDSLTVYGTQIFWPFTSYPVSIGSMFIVDPLYTLPLLIGGLIYLSKRTTFTYKANNLGLIVSSLYLLWSLGVQSYVKSIATESLKSHSLPTNRVLVTPAPLNTILWRIVSMDEAGYHVGYFSLLDKSKQVTYKAIPSSFHMTDKLLQSKDALALTKFSHGFFSIDSIDKHWVISDIRMGIEPDYVFQFAVAKNSEDHVSFITPYRHFGIRDTSRISGLFSRIFDETIDF